MKCTSSMSSVIMWEVNDIKLSDVLFDQISEVKAIPPPSSITEPMIE